MSSETRLRYVNQVPCAMSARVMRAYRSHDVCGIFGHGKDKSSVKTFADTLDPDVFVIKEEENRVLHEDLTRAVSTRTSRPLFDDYVRQS